MNLFFEKELYVGTVATDIIKGTSVHIIDYQIPYETGGRLFMALFTVPFFVILGINGLSLKLAALCFAFIILIVYYKFICKFFGKDVANLFGFLFIFSCPTFSRFNLINSATYLEPTLFIIIVFYFLYKILFENNNPIAEIIYYLAIGCSIGFGISFSYMNAIMLLIFPSFFLIYHRRMALKNLPYLLIGITFGLTPWFYYNITHNYEALFINSVGGFIPIPQWVRFNGLIQNSKNLFFVYLPMFYWFSERWPAISKIFSYTYYFTFIISLVCLVYWSILEKFNIQKREGMKQNGVRDKQPYLEIYKIYPLIIFVFVFSSFFLINEVSRNIRPQQGFTGFRYLIPIYLFQLFFIALFISRLRYLFLRTMLVAFLIFSGIFGMLQDISLKNISEQTYKFYYAYSYDVLGFRLAEAYWSFDEQETIGLIEKINASYRGYAYQGLGWEAASKLASGEIKSLDIANVIQPKYKNDFFIGFGRYTPHEISYQGSETVQPETIDKLQHFIDNVPKENLPDFYYGLGQRRFLTFQENIIDWMEYPQRMKLDTTYLPYYYKGVGYSIGRSFGFNKKRSIELTDKSPIMYRRDCYSGLFLALRDRWLNNQ